MKALKYLREKREFNRLEFGINSIDSFVKEYVLLLKKNNVFSQNVIESFYELDNRVSIFGFDVLKVDSNLENGEIGYKIVFITGSYFNLSGEDSVDLKVIKRQIEGINRLLKKIRSRSLSLGDVNKIEGLQSFILNNHIEDFEIVYLSDGRIKAHQSKLIELNRRYEDFLNIEYFDIDVLEDILGEGKFSKIIVGEDLLEKPKKCTYLESSKLEVYTTYFSGNELYELYRKYNRRLYDNNVRLFLDTKRKGNASMVRTILENPELFVSYNNGLSMVAESVELDNNESIVSLFGLSVVNGGQTLATMFYTGKKHGLHVLDKVRVVAKISCLKFYESAMVSNISRASNTQTAIKNSDFSSNLQEFIRFQRFTQWYNLPNGLPGFQYSFFERLQGERNDLIKRAPDNKTRLEYLKKFPANYAFVKTELSRTCHLLSGNISMAANSAEKQFDVFIDPKNGMMSFLENENYIKILASVVLFNRFRLFCGKKGSTKFPPVGEPSAGMTISIYACGMFMKNFDGKINYLSVFDEKSDSLNFVIMAYLKEAWRVLEILGGAMLQEKAKKSDFEVEFIRSFKIESSIDLHKRNTSSQESRAKESNIISSFVAEMC